MSDNDPSGNESSDGVQTESDPHHVGKRDEHTGVGDVFGIPYTYEHVEDFPRPSGKVYAVTAYLDLLERPIHENTYYVPASRLEDFICDHSHQTFERIVDIQPVSYADAEERMAWFRGEDGDE